MMKINGTTYGKTFSELKRIFSDAGSYREYVAVRYGQILTYGGDWRRMASARSHIHSIARLTGESFDQVLSDIRDDYAVIEAERDMAASD